MNGDQGMPGGLENGDGQLSLPQSETNQSIQTSEPIEPIEPIEPPKTRIRTMDSEWKPYQRTVEDSIMPGMTNEDFWMLIRRFNKVCFQLNGWQYPHGRYIY